MDKKTIKITLTENQIANLINGDELTFKIDDSTVIIRQSYLKDIAADILNRKNRVMNTASNTFEY